MKRFPFQNPVNRSWEDDADTVILGDDLLEEVRAPLEEDEYDTVPLGLKPFRTGAPYIDESAWEEDSVDEYLSEDALEEAEPSAPSFSRPTFEGPLVAGSAFAKPAASVPAYLQASLSENPLRRSSMPPAPLPPLPSRFTIPPQRAEMPTPVMEIFPTLEAIRPESRPPPPPGYLAEGVRIPPASPVPRGIGYAAASHAPSPIHAPSFQARASSQHQEHLDTLRPYAASTGSAVEREGAPSLRSTMRPWIVAARERAQDFVEDSSVAIQDLVAWVAEGSTSGLNRLRAGSPQFWRSAREINASAAQYVNARTATWALGLAFVALFVAAARSPASSGTTAAESAPIVLDADTIKPAAEVSSADGAAASNTAIASKTEVATKTETASTGNDEGAEEDDAQGQDKLATLLERARAGERKAISELNQREPTSLSLEEVQALAVGEEKIAREKTTQTVLAIAQKRRLSYDDATAFLRAVGNPRTYREALLAMAENRSWQGPDLIYLAMRRYRSQEHVADFALSLLLTPRIYKYASPALTVVIDAESMSAEPTSSAECFHVRQLVDRAFEDGDSRSVLHMARFANQTGCGQDDTEDCYPCLRDDNALVDALRAAKTRQPPF